MTKNDSTGIPCFIVLHFIVLYRCWDFYKLKEEPSGRKDDDMLSSFIVVVWNLELNPNISEVSLHSCPWRIFAF